MIGGDAYLVRQRNPLPSASLSTWRSRRASSALGGGDLCERVASRGLHERRACHRLAEGVDVRHHLGEGEGEEGLG